MIINPFPFILAVYNTTNVLLELGFATVNDNFSVKETNQEPFTIACLTVIMFPCACLFVHETAV